MSDWFIVSFDEAPGMVSERFGRAVRFEGEEKFPDFGINVRVLQPGQPNCLYHRENQAEAFLILSGECIAIVEDEEHPMRKGDFLYAPPWTTHVFVGAGEGQCSILMVGTRHEPDEVHYPVSEVAARHGAAADEPTDSPEQAYSTTPRPEPAHTDLPW